MEYELTKKLKNIDLFVPVATNAKIRLDANELPVDITAMYPDELTQAVKDAALNRYPDPRAEKVTKAFAACYGLDPEMCTPGNGSMELLSVILGAFLEKGDTVLTLSPDFSMYAYYSFLSELRVENMPKDESLKINISKVIEKCNNSNIKAVVFSNPCNPTSIGIRRQDILRLVKNVFCLCIIDEAYMDYWDESILGDVQDYDNLIVLRTLTKTGLAGLRLGFAVAQKKISDMLRAVKSTYNTDSITQAIGTFMLTHREETERQIALVKEQREYLTNELSQLADRFFVLERVFPSDTNFVLTRTQKAAELAEKLLEHDIAVRSLGNYLRVTVGTAEENKAFISALTEILDV